VCLVFQQPASFIEADRQILSESYDVVPFVYHGKRDLVSLIRAIRQCDIAYSWFALGHATAAVMISRWLGRRSVVVTGGWDVAAMPEIAYGAMISQSRRRKTVRTLRRADLVLAVSEANRREAAQWVSRDIRVVHLGVDPGFFRPGGLKQDEVATVAAIGDEWGITKKGLDVFLDVARMMPDVAFTVVGVSAGVERTLRSKASANVTFTGLLDRGAVRTVYQRSRVYVQLSAHESFGLAVAEAMACACTPVVSDRGSLPEVVGTAGVVVPYGDSTAAARAIRDALRMDGGRARSRLVETFPLSRRRDQLLALLERLT